MHKLYTYAHILFFTLVFFQSEAGRRISGDWRSHFVHHLYSFLFALIFLSFINKQKHIDITHNAHIGVYYSLKDTKRDICREIQTKKNTRRTRRVGCVYKVNWPSSSYTSFFSILFFHARGVSHEQVCPWERKKMWLLYNVGREMKEDEENKM